MKKNLILSLLILVGLAACKKDNKSAANSTSTQQVNFKATNKASLPPTYTDLQLMPDGSYEGYWSDCGIKVTGIPAWDQSKYPNLVNGVPVTAMNYSTYDGTSSIDAANTGFDGNVFQVTQRYMSLTTFNSDGFDSDLSSYSSAIQSWMGNGQQGTRPNIENYVKDSYTATVGSNQFKTYTGKLIRVTTGSTLAIANMSYPQPVAGSGGTGTISLSIYDPTDNQYPYSVYSTNNIITKAVKNLITYKATGTTIPGSGGVIQVIGTIIRADGSKFNFDTTVAP